MTNILRQTHFEYYMSNAEQQCQNDIVEMIWKAPRNKNFDKEIVQQFKHCYRQTRYPDVELLYDLHKKTDVSNKRIQQWFNNKRKWDTN